MKIKDLYEKFRKGDSLSDNELRCLHEHIKSIVDGFRRTEWYQSRLILDRRPDDLDVFSK